LQKFLNKSDPGAVFMSEGRRVLVGEAILSPVTTIDRSHARLIRAEPENATVEDLVRQHSGLVYRIAYAVLRSHHDAEDATQETFLRVLRRGSRLEAIQDPKTWLARVAWRVAVDRSRRRARAKEIPLEDSWGTVAAVACGERASDEALHGAQIAAALEKLIAALPRKLREPLILSTLEEMSPGEVAATLEINEAAVRSRIFRARRILKGRLAERTARK
jgi:RNA polymerase sigma-70 factor, ECF subfamily